MVLSGLKCNLNEWTSTSYSCDTHLSCTGAWLISPLKICLSPGCYMLSIWMCSLIARATTWQVTQWLSLSCWHGLCHQPRHWAIEMSQDLIPDAGDGLCLLLLSDWRIKGVPGNSCWLFLPGAAAQRGWDMPGSCHCLRKLYSCEGALEKSVWPIRIARTRKVSVKHPGHLHELPLDKWNSTQSFLVPAW